MQSRQSIILSVMSRLFLVTLIITTGTACVRVQDTGNNQQEESPPAGESVKPGTSGNVRDLATAEPNEPGAPAKTVNPRQQPSTPESSDQGGELQRDDSNASDETESQ